MANLDNTKDFGAFCPCRCQKNAASMASVHIDVSLDVKCSGCSLSFFFFPSNKFSAELVMTYLFQNHSCMLSHTALSGQKWHPGASSCRAHPGLWIVPLSLGLLSSSRSLRSFSSRLIQQPWPLQMRAVCTLESLPELLTSLLWRAGSTTWGDQSYCSPITCE